MKSGRCLVENRLTGHNLINLTDLILQIGEDRTKSILPDFCCPINDDVEYFIRHKAIEFSRQELSKTHLVFTSYKFKKHKR